MGNKYIRQVNTRAFWDGFPLAYKSMLQAMYLSDGDYCIRDAMRFLQDHKVNKNEHSGNAKLRYLRWTDRFFRQLCCGMNEDYWKENNILLEEILCCAEGYLMDLSGDYEEIRHSHRTEAGYLDDTNLVNLSQALEFYFCILSWNQGKETEFREGLRNIFASTMRNVHYVISHEDAEALLKYDFYGKDGLNSIEFIYWRPLSWIYDMSNSSDFAHELIPVYEEYVAFLYDMDGDINTGVRDKILLDAETDLQWLYEMNFERMTDEREIDVNHYEAYLNEKEDKIQTCEEKIKTIRSRPHDAGIKMHSSEASERSEDEYLPDQSQSDIASSGYYHRKWHEFTKTLKKYLDEYPSLPVCVFKQNDRSITDSYCSDHNNTECRIGYVHDPHSREFAEKIIAIYVNTSTTEKDKTILLENEIPF